MATTVTVYDFLSNESSTKWKGLLQSALRRVNASCMRQLCVCIYVTNTFGHIYHFVHIPPTLLWTHLSVFCYIYIQAVCVSVCVCVCLCVCQFTKELTLEILWLTEPVTDHQSRELW